MEVLSKNVGLKVGHSVEQLFATQNYHDAYQSCWAAPRGVILILKSPFVQTIKHAIT
jgi:hypothetical protein